MGHKWVAKRGVKMEEMMAVQTAAHWDGHLAGWTALKMAKMSAGRRGVTRVDSWENLKAVLWEQTTEFEMDAVTAGRRAHLWVEQMVKKMAACWACLSAAHTVEEKAFHWAEPLEALTVGRKDERLAGM